MTRINHEKVNRQSKVEGSNPAVPNQKKKVKTKWLRMRSKYNGTCKSCAKEYLVNSWIRWNKETKEVRHAVC